MTTTFYNLFLLLQLRVRLLVRGNPRAGRKGWFSRFGPGIIALIVIGLNLPWILNIATAIYGHAVSGRLGRSLLTPSLEWGLNLMTLFVLFYGTLTVLGMLTTAGNDLQLLLLTPVSPRLLLGEKMVSVSLGFALPMLLSVPAIIAMGNALHLGTLYDVVAVLMVLIVPVPPVAAALLLVVSVLRWIPPARARTVTTIVGFALAASFIVATQLARSPTGFSRPTLPAALPATWPGHALAAVGLGQTTAAVGYLLATLALAISLSGVAIVVSVRFFASGWATYREVGRRKVKEAPVRRSALAAGTRRELRTASGEGRRGLRRLPAWWPLLGKEWLSLRRDPQQLATLGYPLVIVGVWTYQLFARGSANSAFGSAANAVLFFTLTFFAVLSLGSIAPVMVNGDRRSLYLLALAPLSPQDVLFAKWAMCAATVLTVVEAVLVAGAVFLGIAPGATIMGAVGLACLVVALSGVGLTVNLAWPRLNQGDGRVQASVMASIVSFVGDFMLGLIICGLLILIVSAWPSHPWVALALAGALLTVTGLAVGGTVVVGGQLMQSLLRGERG